MKKMKSEEYQEGWREGYLAGFRAARDNDTLMSIDNLVVCHVCGVRRTTNTICIHPKCPSEMD